MTDTGGPSREQKAQAAKEAAKLRYARSPATIGRIEAFNLLELKLVDHARLYETGEAQDQRDAIAASIKDVSEYLTSRGLALAAQRPLMRTLSALVERENGALDPLFCERANRAKGGRPSKSVGLHQQDGAIAAFANYWLKHHADKTRPVKDQFPEVARRLENKGLGSVNAARIKQAREVVSREVADHPARSMHDMIAGWLEQAAHDHGELNAIGVMLPIIAQFQTVWKD